MASRRKQSLIYSRSEDYQSSIADLMAGLVFIFVITLITAALQLSTASNVWEKVKKDRSELLEHLKVTLQLNDVDVSVDRSTGVLRIPQELLFDTGKVQLREEGQEIIEKLKIVFQETLPCFSLDLDGQNLACPIREVLRGKIGSDFSPVDSIYVEGHSDWRPLYGELKKKYEDNLNLSAQRALNVYRKLVLESEKLSELYNDRGDKVFGVSGYGAGRSISSDDSPEELAKDRRIDIRFLMSKPNNLLKIIDSLNEQ